MCWKKTPQWPIEMGIFDPSDHERISAYSQLVWMCDHTGIWRDETYIEPGASLVSMRFLMERWVWKLGKAQRFINFALQKRLFWTQADTSLGRWLKPVWNHSDTVIDTPIDTQIDKAADTNNQTPRWFFISGKISSLANEDQDLHPIKRYLDGSIIILPSQLATDMVVDALVRFWDYRKSVLKKPILSPAPIKRILRHFKSAEAIHLVLAINQSIEHEWVDVYPVTNGTANGAKPSQKETKPTGLRKFEDNPELMAILKARKERESSEESDAKAAFRRAMLQLNTD